MSAVSGLRREERKHPLPSSSSGGLGSTAGIVHPDAAERIARAAGAGATGRTNSAPPVLVDRAAAAQGTPPAVAGASPETEEQEEAGIASVTKALTHARNKDKGFILTIDPRDIAPELPTEPAQPVTEEPAEEPEAEKAPEPAKPSWQIKNKRRKYGTILVSLLAFAALGAVAGEFQIDPSQLSLLTWGAGSVLVLSGVCYLAHKFFKRLSKQDKKRDKTSARGEETPKTYRWRVGGMVLLTIALAAIGVGIGFLFKDVPMFSNQFVDMKDHLAILGFSALAGLVFPVGKLVVNHVTKKTKDERNEETGPDPFSSGGAFIPYCPRRPCDDAVRVGPSGEPNGDT